MRTYSQIQGDGGSGVAEQVAASEERIARRLAPVRHLVAIGSGKGGVGKSTLTRHLASVLTVTGRRVGILDADFNGPSQARLAGLGNRPLLPSEDGLVLPRTGDGIPVLSFGSILDEQRALSWPSVAPGSSHVWRATREAATLAELLAAVAWGPLDVLLVDLPPGPERTAQLANLLGPRTSLLLVTIPSALARGVVARSIDALRPLANRVLGYVENMSGYVCPTCQRVGPLFPEDPDPPTLGLTCLGHIPFDPELALLCDRGQALGELTAGSPSAVATALATTATNLWTMLEETAP